MKPKLSDFLVVSDMDGTLISSDMTISPANIETIRLFTSLGGRFAIATGRVTQSVLRYKELFPFLSLVISGNGSVIYDVKNKKALQTFTLPSAVSRHALQDVMENFPQIGIMVVGSESRPYLLNPNTSIYTLMAEEKIIHFLRPKEEITGEWHKILFTAPADELAKLADFIEARIYPGAYFVPTGEVYYEMLPENVNKGMGLIALCKLLNQPIEYTVAIGDYYNDVSMFNVVGRSVAMGNAPADIRLMADEVTGTCNEGGVGQAIYKLIKEYGDNG